MLESELDAQNSEVAQLKISINELSARSSESEQKLQLLQSKMDELIQQKIREFKYQVINIYYSTRVFLGSCLLSTQSLQNWSKHANLMRKRNLSCWKN